MIDFDGYWMWIRRDKDVPGVHYLDSTKKSEYLQHWGKWLVFGSPEYLMSLSALLSPFVRSGEIDSLKYSIEPMADRTECVLCVYCDDRDRDTTWPILEYCGVSRRIWKYDSQTIKDWKPGGKLYNEVHGTKGEKLK